MALSGELLLQVVLVMISLLDLFSACGDSVFLAMVNRCYGM